MYNVHILNFNKNKIINTGCEQALTKAKTQGARRGKVCVWQGVQSDPPASLGDLGEREEGEHRTGAWEERQWHKEMGKESDHHIKVT